MDYKTKQPVVVCGAGLGGLVLARILQLHGKRVVVYEREASGESRMQGGVLDMHENSGLWALQEAGLEEAFVARALPGGQDTRILNKNGRVLWDEKSRDDTRGRPEIDRPALRSLLLRALLPDTVRWGHQLTAVAPDGEGHLLSFADGTTVHAATLVGADGARSRIRPLLTETRPTYSGVMFMEITIADAARRFPETARTVGRGSMFALGDEKGVLSHLCGDGRIASYVALRMGESGFETMGMVPGDPAATRRALLAPFSDWAKPLKQLIEACDDHFVPRGIYAMPPGVRWPSRSNITMLGDAAHLMSPFAGEGANMALQDGAALGLALVYQKTADAIAFFENKMFERAALAAHESAVGLQMCMAPDGAEQLAAMMRSFHGDPDDRAPDAARSGQGTGERA